MILLDTITTVTTVTKTKGLDFNQGLAVIDTIIKVGGVALGAYFLWDRNKKEKEFRTGNDDLARNKLQLNEFKKIDPKKYIITDSLPEVGVRIPHRNIYI